MVGWRTREHIFLLPSFPLPRGVNHVRAPFSSLDGFGISRPEQKKDAHLDFPPFSRGTKK